MSQNIAKFSQMASPWFSLVAITWLFSLSSYSVKGRGMPGDATGQTIINHWAAFRTRPGKYYGARAALNVYGLPTIKNGQSSSIQIWVMSQASSPSERFNAIQAGWAVNPDLYGDNDTHFFVSWTVDGNYKTECVGYSCEGFIRHNGSELVPGYRLQPLSKYNGEQRFITLKIHKDPLARDWWLYYGPNATKPVGYWPQSLFTSLANNPADQIEIGGIATFRKGDMSPPMGSGHGADEGEGKAASIKYPRLGGERGLFYVPRKHKFDYYADRKDCYKLIGDVADTLYLGGPGGCTD